MRSRQFTRQRLLNFTVSVRNEHEIQNMIKLRDDHSKELQIQFLSVGNAANMWTKRRMMRDRVTTAEILVPKSSSL